MNPANNEYNFKRESAPNAPDFTVASSENASPNVVSGLPNIPKIPEIPQIGSPEQLSNPETQTGPGQSSAAVNPNPAAQTMQPTVVVPTTTPSDNSSTNSGNPVAAADEDLIEKEWVDKAKGVIAQTRSDPHAQAKQIAELMRDYVKKRYGRVVGKAPEDL